MSSSTFAVSVSKPEEFERDIDLELDACEENGIMSTSIEGELPKDHTYTKEPDNSEKDIDQSSNQLEDMFNNVPAENSRPSRTARSSKAAKKPPAKPKAKPAKRETVSKRNKAKVVEPVAEDIATEDITAIAANGEVENEETGKTENEVKPKPAKRGKKRKVEEKENVVESTPEEPVVEVSDKESPPSKKQSTRTKKPTKSDKSTKKEFADDTTDTSNLPKGWVRKTVTRKSGKSAGQCDVYIYSPDGLKFRSKPDIAAYLMSTKSNLKLDLFDFSKKKLSHDSPSTPQKKLPSAKPKTPPPKKKPSTPKKSPKLLVKIVSEKRKGAKASKAKGRKASKSQKKK